MMRRPKILNVQKERLVSLIQNFFIQSVGYYENAGETFISMETWVDFASILNPLGAYKTAFEWKQSFNYMKSRVRSKVAMILQSGASLEDNLSETDQVIYSMYPFSTVENERVADRENENLTANTNDDNDCQEYCSVDLPIDELVDMEGCHILNVLTVDEEEKFDQSVKSSASTHEQPQYVKQGTDTRQIGSIGQIQGVQQIRGRRQIRGGAQIGGLGKTLEQEQIRGREPIRGRGQMRGRGRMRGCVGMRVGANEKPPTQVTDTQKERLLQLLENNFLTAFGRYSSSNGAAIKKNLWQKFAEELNTLGPQRTATQWKSMFDYIKGSAKAKLADMRKNRNQRGVALTRMEERVVAICGLNNMDGEQELGEGGFQYEKTIRRGPKQIYNRSDSEDEEGLGIQIFFSDRGRCSDHEDADVIDNRVRRGHQLNQDTDLVTDVNETISLNDTHPENGVNTPHNLPHNNACAYDTQLLESSHIARLSSDSRVNGRSSGVSATITSGTNGLQDFNDRNDRVCDLKVQQNIDIISQECVEPPHSPNHQLHENRDSHEMFVHQSSSGTDHNYVRRVIPATSHRDSPSLSIRLGSINHTTISQHNPTSNRVSTVTDSYTQHGQPRFNTHATSAVPSNGSQESQEENSSSTSRPHESEQSNGVFRSAVPGARRGRGRQVSARTGRGRERQRNRFTSYDMVERSINDQERFIEQANRNHSENKFMFITALNTLANVLSEYLNRTSNSGQ